MTHCEEVIITTQKRVGTGQNITSPIRLVKQVFSKDGDLIAESDPMGNYTVEDIMRFSEYVINSGVRTPKLEDLDKWVKDGR